MTTVKSKYDDIENDLYQTPEWCTEIALRFVAVQGQTVLEPACGLHKIANELTGNGAIVTATDKYRYEGTTHTRSDFILDKFVGIPPTIIFTNPPYGKGNADAVKFIKKALSIVEPVQGKVVMLVPAKIDFGKTRTELFCEGSHCSMMIKMVNRIQWIEPTVENLPKKGRNKGKVVGPSENHMWVVWDYTHEGPSRNYYAEMLPEYAEQIKEHNAAVEAEWQEVYGDEKTV